jgi:hypothetical protein
MCCTDVDTSSGYKLACLDMPREQTRPTFFQPRIVSDMGGETRIQTKSGFR